MPTQFATFDQYQNHDVGRIVFKVHVYDEDYHPPPGGVLEIVMYQKGSQDQDIPVSLKYGAYLIGNNEKVLKALTWQCHLFMKNQLRCPITFMTESVCGREADTVPFRLIGRELYENDDTSFKQEESHISLEDLFYGQNKLQGSDDIVELDSKVLEQFDGLGGSCVSINITPSNYAVTLIAPRPTRPDYSHLSMTRFGTHLVKFICKDLRRGFPTQQHKFFQAMGRKLFERIDSHPDMMVQAVSDFKHTYPNGTRRSTPYLLWPHLAIVSWHKLDGGNKHTVQGVQGVQGKGHERPSAAFDSDQSTTDYESHGKKDLEGRKSAVSRGLGYKGGYSFGDSHESNSGDDSRSDDDSVSDFLGNRRKRRKVAEDDASENTDITTISNGIQKKDVNKVTPISKGKHDKQTCPAAADDEDDDYNSNLDMPQADNSGGDDTNDNADDNGDKDDDNQPFLAADDDDFGCPLYGNDSSDDRDDKGDEDDPKSSTDDDTQQDGQKPHGQHGQQLRQNQHRCASASSTSIMFSLTEDGIILPISFHPCTSCKKCICVDGCAYHNCDDTKDMMCFACTKKQQQQKQQQQQQHDEGIDKQITTTTTTRKKPRKPRWAVCVEFEGLPKLPRLEDLRPLTYATLAGCKRDKHRYEKSLAVLNTKLDLNTKEKNQRAELMEHLNEIGSELEQNSSIQCSDRTPLVEWDKIHLKKTLSAIATMIRIITSTEAEFAGLRTNMTYGNAYRIYSGNEDHYHTNDVMLSPWCRPVQLVLVISEILVSGRGSAWKLSKRQRRTIPYNKLDELDKRLTDVGYRRIYNPNCDHHHPLCRPLLDKNRVWRRHDDGTVMLTINRDPVVYGDDPTVYGEDFPAIYKTKETQKNQGQNNVEDSRGIEIATRLQKAVLAVCTALNFTREQGVPQYVFDHMLTDPVFSPHLLIDWLGKDEEPKDFRQKLSKMKEGNRKIFLSKIRLKTQIAGAIGKEYWYTSFTEAVIPKKEITQRTIKRRQGVPTDPSVATASATAEAAPVTSASLSALQGKGVASMIRGLTEDELCKVEMELYSTGNREEIIAQHGQDFVQRQNFRTLRCNEWLSDEVIHIFCKLLSLRDEELCNEDPSRHRSHFFQSFTITNLLNEGHRTKDGEYQYSNVKRFGNRVSGGDIFQLDKIFIPINVDDRKHWILACIFMQEKKIRTYDSFKAPREKYIDVLFQYLKDEHEKKKGAPLPDADKWNLRSIQSDTPLQQNGVDCGVFTCMFAYFLSTNGRLDFNQGDIHKCRKLIALSILEGKVTNFQS